MRAASAFIQRGSICDHLEDILNVSGKGASEDESGFGTKVTPAAVHHACCRLL
jgi:hypothetical protein